ncbi:MAG TPA: hypothetical protein VGW10_13745, partial [Solirubrobacteraceae bacterium]|nr:hypothetical protein [Solirubrobacteraceae bacterium]
MTPSPRVLIVAERDDPDALLMQDRLRRLHGCEATLLDMSTFPVEQQAALVHGSRGTGATAYLGDLDLADVGAVWWRRPRRSAVPSEYYLFDVDFLQVECDHFLEGLLWSLPAVWVNHPTDEILASRKLHQLATAARVGLVVPATVVTNDPARAREFVESAGGPVITKRIGTTRGLATQTLLISATDIGRLDSIRTCPTLLQRY